jgi:hypothetical protein
MGGSLIRESARRGQPLLDDRPHQPGHVRTTDRRCTRAAGPNSAPNGRRPPLDHGIDELLDVLLRDLVNERRQLRGERQRHPFEERIE